MDFLAAFSTALDVVDTNQMTQRQTMQKISPKDSKKPTPPCLKTTRSKHESMQPCSHCRDLTEGGAASCIQPPGAKENSRDIETQPWEAQAAAPLLLLPPPQQKKIHGKDLW